MNDFSQNLDQFSEPVHSLNEVELAQLQQKYNELKHKVEKENYELTLEDQKDILSWRRADRETKFILNQKPVKEKKVKEPKPPREKKPKKLSKAALGKLLLKEMNGEELTEEELRNKNFTLGLENEITI